MQRFCLALLLGSSCFTGPLSADSFTPSRPTPPRPVTCKPVNLDCAILDINNQNSFNLKYGVARNCAFEATYLGNTESGKTTQRTRSWVTKGTRVPIHTTFSLRGMEFQILENSSKPVVSGNLNGSQVMGSCSII